MARGSETGQRASRHFLFGPRPLKAIDRQKQRELDADQRRRTKDRSRRQHSDLVASAGQHFLNGDGRPLADLLASQPPTGTVAAEGKALRQLIDRFAGYYDEFSPQRPLPTPQAVDGLAALQALYQRAGQRHLSRHYQDLVIESARVYLQELVGNELDRRLDVAAPEIGPLPSIWMNNDNRTTHLRSPEGDFLCGAGLSDRSTISWHPAHRGLALPLIDPTSCQDCLQALAGGAQTRNFEPPEWLDLWRQRFAAAFVYRFPIMLSRVDIVRRPPEQLYHTLLAASLKEMTTVSRPLGIELPPSLTQP